MPRKVMTTVTARSGAEAVLWTKDAGRILPLIVVRMWNVIQAATPYAIRI